MSLSLGKMPDASDGVASYRGISDASAYEKGKGSGATVMQFDQTDTATPSLDR